MIRIEHTETLGWETAIRGMRNPMNSWDKGDSYYTYVSDTETHITVPYAHFVGKNDHDLMMRLAKGGSVHAKYRRMIVVTCDITAPLYWWKEFDTYKVGTVANSCSTMHKIHSKPFVMDDFSHEHLCDDSDVLLYDIVGMLNKLRMYFLASNDMSYWHQMIQLLPSSYNQKRTIMMNYEVLVGIYRDRRNHKLDEWHTLCDWIEDLPYSEIITGEV